MLLLILLQKEYNGKWKKIILSVIADDCCRKINVLIYLFVRESTNGRDGDDSKYVPTHIEVIIYFKDLLSEWIYVIRGTCYIQ